MWTVQNQKDFINAYNLYERLLNDKRYQNVSIEFECDKEGNIVYLCVVADEIDPREKYLYCEV